jgi:hypothetical protein
MVSLLTEDSYSQDFPSKNEGIFAALPELVWGKVVSLKLHSGYPIENPQIERKVPK